jgi:hypothetical protein
MGACQGMDVQDQVREALGEVFPPLLGESGRLGLNLSRKQGLVTRSGVEGMPRALSKGS